MSYPESPDDAILLVKLHKSSQQLSQRQLLLFPAGLLTKLEGKSLTLVARNPVSDSELREFRRKVDAIEQPPWALTQASSYLRSLCAKNQERTWGQHQHCV